MSDETPTETSTVPPTDEAELRRENEELRTKLMYAQAEFENYRKRADREAETFVRFAHEALVARLLAVLDEMDAAVAGLDGDAGAGVRMIRDNFLRALREVGLHEIPAQGLPFDPYLMECIQQVADPAGKEGAVTEVSRKGYRLHERVLRPAHVTVVRNRGEMNG